jgi:hypothetical protein
MSQSLIRLAQSAAGQESISEVLTAAAAVLSTGLLYIAVGLAF